jgi:mevalonate kinase
LKNGIFYSKGKLLLSGEYVVLHGARALAVPLKRGQQMTAGPARIPGIIDWRTEVEGQEWFSAVFSLDDFEVLETQDENTGRFVSDLLRACALLRPELKDAARGYSLYHEIDFDIRWGLGSSSSLVSNLAAWLEIDPWTLYRKVFHGSGYDLFCARAEGAILYSLEDDRPVVAPVNFKPSFTGQLYFVYLGRKQDSQESVRQFTIRVHSDDQLIRKISELTEAFTIAATLDEFEAVMRVHEVALSQVLGLPRVKTQFFADFDGEVKSLGAWGGDFVMVATAMPEKDVRDYFVSRGMPVIFRYEQLVL